MRRARSVTRYRLCLRLRSRVCTLQRPDARRGQRHRQLRSVTGMRLVLFSQSCACAFASCTSIPSCVQTRARRAPAQTGVMRLHGWRKLSRVRMRDLDGFEWDAPASKENAAAFGFPGAGEGDRPAFPKVRVVSISECASHAVVDTAMGGVAGKGAGEQSLARKLYRRLDDDWLLIADRNSFNWADWCTAADSGAQLLWRVKADLTLPVLDLLPDGSYSSVLVSPKIRGKGPGRAHRAPGNLRLPAHPLRPVGPYLPGRHRSGHRPGPGQVQAHRPHCPPPGRRPGGLSPLTSGNVSWKPSWPASPARSTSTRNAGHRTYPRVVKRARHNSYRVKRPADHGTRHPGPATISLVNHRQLTPAA